MLTNTAPLHFKCCWSMKMEEFSYEEIEAATGGFAAKNVVGKGSHGCVYRARLSGGGVGRRGGVTVAVKRASRAQGAEADGKVANEIAVLTAARHLPGVVRLVGVAVAAGERERERAAPLLVMEYMPNGSLHDLLHKSSRPPPWPRRVEIALDVARAVRALHGAEPRVIHRDVKSANILIGRDGRARLADFSLAVNVATVDAEGGSPDDSPAPAPAGTMGYLDPSYTEPGRLGPESDVFSFGVVLLELVSGRKVMDVNASPSSIVAWAVPLIAAGKSPLVFDARIPSPPSKEAQGAITRVLAVAARCVSETVERRPAMPEVASELHGALESAAGWRRRRRGSGRIRIIETVCSRVASWGVKRRARTSKIECTELSGSEGIMTGSAAAGRVDSRHPPSPYSNTTNPGAAHSDKLGTHIHHTTGTPV